MSQKVKNKCPILTDNDYKKINFNFTAEFYKYFNDFIYSHPGKTTSELVKLIDKYNFTEETLVLAFKLFNTWRCTYYNVCGPFIYKQDRWFPVYKKNYTDNLILAEENSRLNIENHALQKEIARLTNQNV